MAVFAACAAAATTGCRSVAIENKGEGKGWTVDVFTHWMNSEADNIEASISPDGIVHFTMNGMKSTASDEFNKMMNTTFTGFESLARLAAGVYAPAAATKLTTEADAASATSSAATAAACTDGACSEQ